MAEVYNIEDGYCVDGFYPVFKTHELRNPLHIAIEELEAVAMRFSLDFIKDAKQRDIYNSRIKVLSEQVLSDVTAGKMNPVDGAKFANHMRNHIMREIRLVSSPQGRALAQKWKPDSGKSWEEIIKQKSNDRFKKPFDDLTKAQQDVIYYDVITSGGKNKPEVSAQTKKLRVMGRVLIVVTGVLATYAILTAEDKLRETVIQASAIGGGVAGGALAGLAVPAVCGPSAPVCAVALVLLGSVAVGLFTEAVAVSIYDADFMEEAEEFSKWVS